MIQFFKAGAQGFTEIKECEPGCWINVEVPDDNDFSFLIHKLGIPEPMLAYTSDIEERPRIEREDNWVLTILRIPMRSHTSSVPFITVPIGIITGKCSDGASFILTICYHHTELLTDFIDHMQKKSICAINEPQFILRMIFSAAYWYLTYLKRINSMVSHAEKELERSVRNRDLLQLMKMQKSLVFFNTSLRGNEVLIARVRHVFSESEMDMDLLDDVEIELKQALNTVSIYTDILNSTLDAFASIISNNVNMIMKRMTAVTIVLMVPTGIASFYGMNVNIGLSGYKYAFWIIVGVSILITGALCLVLRRCKWF